MIAGASLGRTSDIMWWIRRITVDIASSKIALLEAKKIAKWQCQNLERCVFVGFASWQCQTRTPTN